MLALQVVLLFHEIPAGQNWKGIWNAVRYILVESCSQLVNPNGSLTQPDGQRAYVCIQSGIVIGVGGIILAHGNLASLPYFQAKIMIMTKKNIVKSCWKRPNRYLDILVLIGQSMETGRKIGSREKDERPAMNKLEG
jgi:hypothetical protein